MSHLRDEDDAEWGGLGLVDIGCSVEPSVCHGTLDHDGSHTPLLHQPPQRGLVVSIAPHSIRFMHVRTSIPDDAFACPAAGLSRTPTGVACAPLVTPLPSLNIRSCSCSKNHILKAGGGGGGGGGVEVAAEEEDGSDDVGRVLSWCGRHTPSDATLRYDVRPAPPHLRRARGDNSDKFKPMPPRSRLRRRWEKGSSGFEHEASRLIVEGVVWGGGVGERSEHIVRGDCGGVRRPGQCDCIEHRSNPPHGGPYGSSEGRAARDTGDGKNKRKKESEEETREEEEEGDGGGAGMDGEGTNKRTRRKKRKRVKRGGMEGRGEGWYVALEEKGAGTSCDERRGMARVGAMPRLGE